MKNKKIAILGDGGWGTALAIVLSRKRIPVTLWGPFPDYLEELRTSRKNRKFLPHLTFPLPEEISFNADLKQVIASHDIIIAVIPTAYLRKVLSDCTKLDLSEKIFVSCTKGIEKESFLTPSGVIKDVLGISDTVVLSGPSHAEEVANHIPTCVVVASQAAEKSDEVQALFMEQMFRVYTSSDVLGVELGGALKNVIAIAAGICDGLSFGSNTKAALLSRGLQEVVRFGLARGAQKPETFFGLSGMGDLVTTCVSPFGRNRAVGERVARGEKIADIEGSMEMVAEGVYTTRSAYALAQDLKIEMPITQEVYKVLYDHKDPLESISDLMLRGSKNEMSFSFKA
jgi:glycerol-3-phosphate dehydrogenase (NAD(P)+)